MFENAETFFKFIFTSYLTNKLILHFSQSLYQFVSIKTERTLPADEDCEMWLKG